MAEEPLDHLNLTQPDDAARAEQPAWVRFVELVVAVAVVALGVLVLIKTQDIPVPKAFATTGPRVFPAIVGWSLIAVGIWYAIDVLRGNTAAPPADSEDVDPTLPPDLGVLAGLGLTLAVYAFLIERAGFVIASALLFFMAAVVMGSRSFVRDIAIGIILAFATWYVFYEWLGIRLPKGILDGLL